MLRAEHLPQPRRAWMSAELSHDRVIVSWLPSTTTWVWWVADHPDDPRHQPGAGASGLPGQADPARWMRWLSQFHGASAGPNFSYALATRALNRRDLDLSQVRMFLNGAEPIDAPTFPAVPRGRGRFGLEPGVAFRPSAWQRCASQGASPTRAGA